MMKKISEKCGISLLITFFDEITHCATNVTQKSMTYKQFYARATCTNVNPVM